MASPSPERAKAPVPTWIPYNKASASSWRAGPSEVPSNGWAAASREEDTTRYVVRVAKAPLSAIRSVVEADAQSLATATVCELSAPRAIAKGSTPQTGPAAPLLGGDELSPGESPATAVTAITAAESTEGGGMPAMVLPPSINETAFKTSGLSLVVCLDQRVADSVAKRVESAVDGCACDVQRVQLPGTCTIVMKGVPLSVKQERLWDELCMMRAATPTYLRFHRNDRGLFKNVVYVKFPSKVDAMLGLMEVERLSVGGRPLKAEYKKPRTVSTEEQNRAEAARREDLKAAALTAVEAAVRDLLKKDDMEAFSFGKQALSKEEQRFLRSTCASHELSIDTTPASIVVKKKNGKQPSPANGPARTPPFQPTTPSVHASDPEAVSGLQFRGIRHWREQRATTMVQALHRCLGPADVKEPFSAGRGRPAR